MATTRDLDVVVFGATGDIGVAGCCCLYFKGKMLGVTSWAPAARNLAKLQKDVLDRLQAAEPGPQGLAPAAPIKADSSDYASLVAMCGRAKCVIACAGPYAKYGEGVVKACIEAGTHYVDLTGETPWVQKMCRKYAEEAERQGVSIVSLAGYDSVPPDLSANLAAKTLEKAGLRLGRFEAFIGCSGGMMPSGTIDTLLQGVEQAKRRALNVCTLGMLGNKPRPAGSPASALGDGGQAPSQPRNRQAGRYLAESEQGCCSSDLFWTMWPGYSPLAGRICFPHFMAPINVVTVHHTAAKEGYGGLVYRERVRLSDGPTSLYGLIPAMVWTVSALLFGFFLALPGSSPMTAGLRDYFNAAPSKRVRDKLFNGFKSTGNVVLHGLGAAQGDRAVRVRVKMSSEYDAGIGFTMLSACTVAAQMVKRNGTPEAPKPGFQSAVTALGGEALANALRASGMSVEAELVGGASSKL